MSLNDFLRRKLPTRTVDLPFGTDWYCVTCEKAYPDEFEGNTCPDDGGHLHRIAGGIGVDIPTDKETMMKALRQIHAAEPKF